MSLLACLSGCQIVGMVLGLAGMATLIGIVTIVCNCWLKKSKIKDKKEEREFTAELLYNYKKEENKDTISN